MQKSLKHLQADQVIKSVFTPAPFVSFRKARNLRSHLVQFKLYHFATYFLLIPTCSLPSWKKY